MAMPRPRMIVSLSFHPEEMLRIEQVREKLSRAAPEGIPRAKFMREAIMEKVARLSK